MNKKIIIIIIAAVVVVGAGAAFFLMGGEKESELFPHKYLPGEYMVTNVKGSNHLLKTSIALVLETPNEKELTKDELAALDNKQSEMRDIINTIQREQTMDDLESDGIKEKLRDEIVSALKSQLDIENLKTLYFNDFVIQ